MKLSSKTFLDRRALPTRCAFGRFRFYPRELEDHERFELSENKNPHLAWVDAPAGTQSFALIVRDQDAPKDVSDANQKGRVVPRAAERGTFVHCVLVDLPPGSRAIEEGALSDGVTAGGKSQVEVPGGGLQGVNDYTSWFADDAAMKGTYRGYDGPCPPWNDELIHWYEFTLYALDVESLGLTGDFDAAGAEKAMEGHVLAEAVIEGFYYIHAEARFGERSQMCEREQEWEHPESTVADAPAPARES